MTLDDVNHVGVEGTGEHHHVVSSLSIAVAPTNDPPVIHVPGDHRNYTYDGIYTVTHVDTLVTDEDVRSGVVVLLVVLVVLLVVLLVVVLVYMSVNLFPLRKAHSFRLLPLLLSQYCFSFPCTRCRW